MNRRRIWVAALITLLSSAHLASAATEISGDIEGDTLWNKAGSPYVVTDQVIAGIEESNVTLTIEPGVIVKFMPDSWLAITGSLIANGTQSEPIYFTSIKNDSIGGDTNNDGNATQPSPSDNWSLVMYKSPGNTLSNIKVSYSQGGIQALDSTLAASDVEMQNNSIAVLASNGNSYEIHN